MAKKKNEIASITSSELAGLIFSPFGSEVSKPFSRQIFLTHMYLNGSNHVDDIEEYIEGLSIGDRVQMLREPKNEYDEYAVVVRDMDGNKLGYIPRNNNHIVARLMDAGKLLYGIVTNIRDMDDMEYYSQYRPIQIAIYMED